MAAGSKMLSCSLTIVPLKEAEQSLHTTLTGYIQSAPKPSAHNRRVANTSPYTSPFVPPNFTFTSSSGVIWQANFGDLPVSVRLTYVQLTVWPNSNASWPVGPRLMSVPAVSVGSQTRARAMTWERALFFDRCGRGSAGLDAIDNAPDAQLIVRAATSESSAALRRFMLFVKG